MVEWEFLNGDDERVAFALGDGALEGSLATMRVAAATVSLGDIKEYSSKVVISSTTYTINNMILNGGYISMDVST